MRKLFVSVTSLQVITRNMFFECKHEGKKKANAGKIKIQTSYPGPSYFFYFFDTFFPMLCQVYSVKKMREDTFYYQFSIFASCIFPTDKKNMYANHATQLHKTYLRY